MHDDALKLVFRKCYIPIINLFVLCKILTRWKSMKKIWARNLRDKSIEHGNKNIHIFLTPGNHIRFIFSWPWNFKIRKEFKFDGSLKIFIPNVNDYLVGFILMVVTFFNNFKYSIVFIMGFEPSMGVKKSCISWIKPESIFSKP